MFDMEIDSNPEPEVIVARFNKWGNDIRSYREPLKRSIQRSFAPSIRLNFMVGGRPAWDPLQPDTIRQKLAKGQSLDPLKATNKLQRVAGQLNIWNITRNSAKVAQLPGADYGFVHQGGYPEGNIPQRQFLVLQSEDLDDMQDIFLDWLIERGQKARAI